MQILIQQLALIIDPDDHSLMSPINTINSGINFVLDEDATGGGSCKGHYYVLLLHLYRKLKHDKFISLLTADKHQQVRMSFKCLSSAENALKVSLYHVLRNAIILVTVSYRTIQLQNLENICHLFLTKKS